MTEFKWSPDSNDPRFERCRFGSQYAGHIVQNEYAYAFINVLFDIGKYDRADADEARADVESLLQAISATVEQWKAAHK